MSPRTSRTRGFLFCDLRGYTAFVEAHGDRAAAELLERYRAIVRTAVARAAGAEIRTEGDGFYIVFPSASPAVRCGLEIVAAPARHRRRGAAHPGRRRGPRRRVGRGCRGLRRLSGEHRRPGVRRGPARRGPRHRDGPRPRPHEPAGRLRTARPAPAQGHRRADRPVPGLERGPGRGADQGTCRRTACRPRRCGLRIVAAAILAGLGRRATRRARRPRAAPRHRPGDRPARQARRTRQISRASSRSTRRRSWEPSWTPARSCTWQTRPAVHGSG
jgi:hypothetical protein